MPSAARVSPPVDACLASPAWTAVFLEGLWTRRHAVDDVPTGLLGIDQRESDHWPGLPRGRDGSAFRDGAFETDPPVGSQPVSSIVQRTYFMFEYDGRNLCAAVSLCDRVVAPRCPSAGRCQDRGHRRWRGSRHPLCLRVGLRYWSCTSVSRMDTHPVSEVRGSFGAAW